ncbi:MULTISPECIES: YihY/virulence factor BrkB family protein [unclassified Streptomyces]|uniref:YihY/virulence factor BrkB family protein n=1 Tax=unclassified Streptomyces TaxID=2593676 RepID=UPI002DD7D236|nr:MULTISPECIES: YihY/virulence factor BrkB family protein [unclassified Streptomyces]WSF83771.1 YihY/virulence factor BrkB family protein [Streptomyces sp. NBC_01744]WSC39945.1 YihY/virulence factor BrkB family protein [Streptomyces sp. NBC_01763]WSC48112.1 YihY/virulence factor BrkB family protein [Streptomyces sp. NBC_01762]WSC52926.1 YihY/virulence factor BrkB family protein [Streptomyces sp. NBC_01761]WSD27761.1 YihY/virulence factor BrkB family protein [Streptomyces sp. NBC_01751]
MQAANETPERPPGRLHRARVLYRNVSKRQMVWQLLKDTVNSCMEYRILGLAAEAAFFTLLSLPPLLLGLIGLLGYVDEWTNTTTVASIERNILNAAQTVLSQRGVNDFAKPLLADVTTGARPDVISIGFAIALWSGSRAVNVFIDTITVMYGLDGHRGIVKTRLLSFLLYIVALLLGAVVLPLLVVGPDRVVEFIPWGTEVISVFYWPLVILLSIAFLTTLYHVSVPVRSPWIEDVPGALVAFVMWVVGSFLLRIYLTSTVEGPTIYGSLAAPIAVLLWIGISAFAVLVGAAVNAAIDRVWPSLATAAARAANDRVRAVQAAELLARAQAENAEADWDDIDEGDTPYMPSEFPERWSKFLPPDDVKSRLRQPSRDKETTKDTSKDADRQGKGSPKSRP